MYSYRRKIMIIKNLGKNIDTRAKVCMIMIIEIHTCCRQRVCMLFLNKVCIVGGPK